MPERIAILLPGLYDGGAESTMINLAKGMSERGYAVDFVLGRAEGPFMAAVPAGVRVIDLNASRVFFSTPALLRYLRRERPAAMLSVLHSNIIAAWAKRLSRHPFRLILCEQNNMSSVAKGERDLRWQVFPTLAKWFYPWADGVVAVSQGVADDLLHLLKIPPETVQVIFNPIVTPEVFEKAAEPLEDPWFRPGEPPVLLAVGRLTGQKAFDVLLEAFARVRIHHDARLLILGEGDDRPLLERQIGELNLSGCVRMPGFVSNPYQYMARAAAFVLSSRWEGLPTVLVEAMALTPSIIATDCPSGPMEILKNGKYGQMVPVDDAAALAEAMSACLSQKPGTQPRESWAPFSLEAVVDQYIQALVGH
jgi:glycosyltransferase involved in cell wall biosynthesis